MWLYKGRKISKKKLFIFYSIIFLFFFSFFCIHGKNNFVMGDAQTYWESAKNYIDSQGFAFENFDFPVRGYLYPFILFIIQRIGNFLNIDPTYIFWVVMSIFYMLLICLIIPRLFEKIFKIKIKNYVLFVVTLLFGAMYLFEGLIVYCLSDLPAFALFLISISFLLNVIGSQKGKKVLLYSLLSGIFMAATYYFRPAYSLTLFLIFIVYILILVIDKNIFSFAKILLFVLGLYLIAIPQFIINSKNYQIISPTIQTQLFYKGEDLGIKQLMWGIQLQKYETNIDLDTWPTYQVYFRDLTGEKLLTESNINGFDSYLDYFKFVLSHPIDISMIYLKHIFNGLDITYNEVYIQDIYSNRFFIQIFNYSMIFWGLFTGIKICKRRGIKDKSILIIYALILSTVVLAIPTAVEPRFFIPIHMLLLACFSLFVSNFKDYVRESLNSKVLLIYIIFIIICFLLNKSTFDVLQIPVW